MTDEFKPTNEIIRRIYNYYEVKYRLGLIALLKCMAVASLRAKNQIPLNLLVVAPSRQYKSKTSEELFNIFPREYLIDPGADFTMHSLLNLGSKKLNNKTLLISDLTLLLSSKDQRTKERLINGLAMLLSDHYYIYSDRLTNKPLELRCKINIIANITIEAFNRYKRTLIENTFGERFLKNFYIIPLDTQEYLLEHQDERKKMKWEHDKIKMSLSDTSFPEALKPEFHKHTKILAIPALSTNLDDMGDKVKSILYGYQKLQGKNSLEKSDLEVLNHIEPHLGMNDSRTFQIQKMYLSGMLAKDIIAYFGYDDKDAPFVYKVIKELKDRGVAK
jgi:hypothetical protein